MGRHASSIATLQNSQSFKNFQAFLCFYCPCSDGCEWSQVTFRFASHVESWISEDIAGASENSQGLQPCRDAFCKTLQSADLHRCIHMFQDSQIQFSYILKCLKSQCKCNTFLDVEIQWLRPSLPLHPHERFVLYFSLNQGIELHHLRKQEDTELNSCRIPNPVPQNENSCKECTKRTAKHVSIQYAMTAEIYIRGLTVS